MEHCHFTVGTTNQHAYHYRETAYETLYTQLEPPSSQGPYHFTDVGSMRFIVLHLGVGAG